jgi:hypothetical protein
MSQTILIAIPLLPLLFMVYSTHRIYRGDIRIKHQDITVYEHFVIVLGMMITLVLIAMATIIYYYFLFTKIIVL